VLVNALWCPAPGRDPRERYLVDLRADELKPEIVRDEQFVNGLYCDHCGKAFISERELSRAANVRLLATRAGSWIALIGLVEDDFPDKYWASWKEFILPLLRTCVDAGLDQYFRVGQSMSHIIFSTAEEHRLEKYSPSPLRITLRSEDKGQRWYIARSCKNLHFNKPDREDMIDSGTAFITLKSCLSDLWIETRPGYALPGPLASD
jgi:hypothetical protein